MLIVYVPPGGFHLRTLVDHGNLYLHVRNKGIFARIASVAFVRECHVRVNRKRIADYALASFLSRLAQH